MKAPLPKDWHWAGMTIPPHLKKAFLVELKYRKIEYSRPVKMITGAIHLKVNASDSTINSIIESINR